VPNYDLRYELCQVSKTDKRANCFSNMSYESGIETVP